MDVRAYRPEDLETLWEIDQRCFPGGISYSRRELGGFIGDSSARTWVAEEGGVVAGFVVANREPQDIGHIVTIDVLEAWRRRGVGKLLMDAAKAWAGSMGLRLIYLETAEENLAAQRFYAARGYRKVERVEHYYGSGAAAWVMVKRLENQRRGNRRKPREKTLDF